jgi:hypothetical protein
MSEDIIHENNRKFWVNVVKNTVGYNELETEAERKAFLVGAECMFAKMGEYAAQVIGDRTREAEHAGTDAAYHRQNMTTIANLMKQYQDD